MPTLHIDGLHCIKQRDPIGKDEIDFYVTIDSGAESFLSGPHFLDTSKNDDFVNLHEDRNFSDQIKVRLKERNGDRGGNNDKDLGAKTFDNTELSNGGQMVFGTDGVSYTVDYRITA
jgi:hypothetical protein